jgi:hypothetical protein
MLPQLSKEIYKQSTLSFGSFLVFSQMCVTRIHFIYFNVDKNFRLAIQRLEIANNDPQNRIAKEVSEESAHVLIGLGLLASSSLIVSASQARGAQFYKQVWKEENKRCINQIGFGTRCMPHSLALSILLSHAFLCVFRMKV